MQHLLAVIEASLSRQQRVNKAFGGEVLTGACPWCGGTDRLHVYPDANYVPGVGCLGWYHCMDFQQGRAGCGRKGDVFTYLKERRGLAFREVCVQLGIDAHTLITYRQAEKGDTGGKQMCYREPEKALAEVQEQWRGNAKKLAAWASSQFTPEVLDYLHSRNITDHSIKAHLLGYYPHYKKVDARLWGAKGGRMRIPRGLVIPWFNDTNEIICIRFRRLPGDESEEAREVYGVDERTGKINRYRALFGSASAHLYGGSLLLPGCRAVLFEGELDAIVAEQSVAATGIVCVATGSTAWGRSTMSARKLAACHQALVCFDADANGAGDKSAAYWLNRLENARRWRPLWRDANDMYRDGVDLSAWLLLGFEEIASIEEPEESYLCGPCLDEGLTTEVASDALFYDEDEQVLCRRHVALHVGLVRERIESHEANRGKVSA